MNRAAIITDISGLGNCSGSTDIAVLSAMGIECCLIPTAVLSAQTGFADYFMCDLSDYMDGCISSLEKISPHFDAVYTGFFSNCRQADKAIDMLSSLTDGATLILTDPILGDKGKRFPFITDELKERIRILAEKSDIITPNITEFCILTDTDYGKAMSLPDTERYILLAEGCKQLFDKGLTAALITGIGLSDGRLANLTVTPNGFEQYEAERYGGSYSGTGDLFTAIVCGSLMQGISVHDASVRAARFISKVLRENSGCVTDRNYGIPYQKYLKELTE